MIATEIPATRELEPNGSAQPEAALPQVDVQPATEQEYSRVRQFGHTLLHVAEQTGHTAVNVVERAFSLFLPNTKGYPSGYHRTIPMPKPDKKNPEEENQRFLDYWYKG